MRESEWKVSRTRTGSAWLSRTGEEGERGVQCASCWGTEGGMGKNSRTLANLRTCLSGFTSCIRRKYMFTLKCLFQECDIEVEVRVKGLRCWCLRRQRKGSMKLEDSL